MRTIIDKINRMEEIILQNCCWLKLMQGYCINISNNIEEMENLLPLIEIILKEHYILRDSFEQISNEYYKEYFCLTENNK